MNLMSRLRIAVVLLAVAGLCACRSNYNYIQNSYELPLLTKKGEGDIKLNVIGGFAADGNYAISDNIGLSGGASFRPRRHYSYRVAAGYYTNFSEMLGVEIYGGYQNVHIYGTHTDNLPSLKWSGDAQGYGLLTYGYGPRELDTVDVNYSQFFAQPTLRIGNQYLRVGLALPFFYLSAQSWKYSLSGDVFDVNTPNGWGMGAVIAIKARPWDNDVSVTGQIGMDWMLSGSLKDHIYPNDFPRVEVGVTWYFGE